MNATAPTATRLFSFPGICATRSSEITLPKGAVHSWTGNRVGMLIEAREGALWLTQAGDSQDVILTRGQSFRVDRPGRVVVESLSSLAHLLVCPGS